MAAATAAATCLAGVRPSAALAARSLAAAFFSLALSFFLSLSRQRTPEGHTVVDVGRKLLLITHTQLLLLLILLLLVLLLLSSDVCLE